MPGGPDTWAMTDWSLQATHQFSQLDGALGSPVEDLTNSVDAPAAGTANEVSGGAASRCQGGVKLGGFAVSDTMT
jgi:hypothetical protein